MLFRKHPLEVKAEAMALQVQAKLTRMGFKHRVKRRDYDELYQVEWREVQVSPQFVRLRIDIDNLPEHVTTAKLKDEVTLNDLGHALGHAVTFDDRDKKEGCWFVIHLGERDGIPKYVPFEHFIQSYPGGAPMTIPIGQGLTGPLWRDLREMPHLLVAGATGKGKSVMVHAILATLLHLPPTRLRVVLADLKGGMTLGKYKKIPHLKRGHYVRSAKDLPHLLLMLQEEMERRVNAMEDVAEDIDEWNKARPADQQWPYILVIIEELANAMLSKARIKLHDRSMTVAAATEIILADMAARARAAGIHIIATTQSPRSDVISGIIKANFPNRIAFGTASDMDSRVIIDSSRAQGLDKGRMVYLDCADYHELQAPFLSEEERAKILKATLAGDHWLVAQNNEQRLVNHVRLVLEVAERDFANVLDLSELVRVPDIKNARMPPDRVKECIDVMVADGVVSKRFLSKTYKVAVPAHVWREKYPEREMVLSPCDTSMPTDGEDVIEAEVVSSNTTAIPVSLLASGDEFAELRQQIRQWDMLGYSRKEMCRRMGMDSNKAFRLIIETLGPSPKAPKRKQAPPTCSNPS